MSTAMRAVCTALPQGPSLRSELCCLGPSTLTRPHPSQGLENALIEGVPMNGAGRVHRQSRLGGLLNFYKRAA